jgi:hypothetical protein
MFNCQKTNLYFVFYHSLELDMICGNDDNDGASYEGMKFLDMLGCLFLCLCVVVVELVMVIKSGSSRN